ncbi:Membrane protein 3 strong transmembrane helices (TMpred server) [Streptococcus sp. HSISB1]|nr:Membrane protein 3 strong transmembrane helices (TMpred server) [Streptococcus sp. HSISB1]
MTQTASLFISIVIILFVVYSFHLIKKDKLSIRYSLSWYILSVILLIAVWFPNLLVILAKILGIYSPINLVFFVGFCLSLWILFSLTRVVSIQTSKIKSLAQQIALSEKKDD